MSQLFNRLLAAVPNDHSASLNDACQALSLKIDDTSYTAEVIEGLDYATALCHGLAVESGWWKDPATGEPKERNDGELLMLMVSEIAEAMEGVRKNKQDDHLPHRKSVEVELADCLIRIFDYAGARGLDLSGAVIEKLALNQTRADHKPENRAKSDGKKF